MYKLQFVSMGEADDVLIFDLGEGPSLLIALAEIDRQICNNCGPSFSLANDPVFNLEEFRAAMSSVGSTYSRRDSESKDDDFDLILREL